MELAMVARTSNSTGGVFWDLPASRSVGIVPVRVNETPAISR